MLRRNYANIVATIALVLALTSAGATAGVQKLITGKNIKNGSVTSQDLATNSVKSADVATGAVASSDLATNAVKSADVAAGAIESGDLGDGAVQSTDLGDGAVQSPDIATDAVGGADIAAGAVGSSEITDGSVTPAEVTLPPPTKLTRPGPASADVAGEFAQVAAIGTFDKADGASAMSVTWTGSAGAGFQPCVFQVRVDGQPAGGETYVPNGGAVSVSATALFEGLPAGQHELQVFARTTGGAAYPCTVGPAAVGISQTFVIEEQVS